MGLLILRSSGASQGGGDSPLDLPLVTTEQLDSLTHQGSFTVSDGADYGTGAMFVDWESGSRRLYLQGYLDGTHMTRMSVPSFGGTATQQVALTTVPGSFFTGANAVYCSGSLVYDTGSGKSLYVSKTADYDGDADMTHWICKGTPGIGSFGSMVAMAAVRGTYVRALSGGMNILPTAWADLFGYPCYTIGGRMSVISNAQCGYGFGLFDPADIDSGGPCVVDDILSYDFAHRLEGTGPGDDLWDPYNANSGQDWFSQTNAPLGCAFIFPGTRSLVFVGSHGYGAADNGCRPGSSVNNSPFRLQYTCYDMADLHDVFLENANNYDPRPHLWRELNGWTSHFGSCVGGGAGQGNAFYDYTDDRLYIVPDGIGEDGEVHVWA